MLEVKLGALFGIEQQLGDMDAVWQHLKKKQMEKAFGAWTKPDKPCASPPRRVFRQACFAFARLNSRIRLAARQVLRKHEAGSEHGA